MGAKSQPSGTTNSVSNTEPWKVQQPYLMDIFNTAKYLHDTNTPQYYPLDTYAPQNESQRLGLKGTLDQAAGDYLPALTGGATADILAGKYLYANPSNSVFGSLATTESPEAASLKKYLSGDRVSGTEDPSNALFKSLISTGSPEATGLGAYTSGSRIGGALNPSNAIFQSLASTTSPEALGLSSYTSGSRIGGEGNPYTDALTSNVLARVVPQIQSSFISGGTLPSAEAARATSAGATSALAPLLFAREQQEEANQINATDLLGRLRLGAGGALSTQEQQEAGNQISASEALARIRTGAGAALSTRQQQEESNQIGASDLLSRIRLGAGAGQSTSFTSGMNDVLRGIALSPTAEDQFYRPYREITAAGATQQGLDQASINDAVARWNFGQELPYNQLNNLIGAVTGNYGGTSSLTQPYFGQSTLSQVGQGLGAAAAIPGAVSGISSLFGLFGAL